MTAVIDLELATLGDPMADLAGMLSRDLSEPMGDLTDAFRSYEKLSGEPLDRDAIDFHTIRFCTITPLAVAHLVAAPPPGVDWVQYLGWYCVWYFSPALGSEPLVVLIVVLVSGRLGYVGRWLHEVPPDIDV